MKLNVHERLILSSLLPEKGNFETMGTIEKLRSVLLLTEEEVEKYEFKQSSKGTITWNKEGSEQVEIEISIKGMALLISTLEKLDEKEELDLHAYNIYKRIKEEENIK